MSQIEAGIPGRSKQVLLAILAVVLGTVFVAGACFVHSSLSATVDSVVDAVVDADVYIQPKDVSAADVLLRTTSQQAYVESSVQGVVAALPEVQSATPMYVGPVTLLDQDHAAISPGLALSLAVGASDGEAGPGTLVDGALPASIREVALEEATADRLGLAVGDRTTVVFNGTTLDNVTVTGIVSYGVSMGGSIVVVLNPTAARAMFAPPNTISFLAVRAQTGVSPEQLRDAIAPALLAAQPESDARVDVLVGDQARHLARAAAIRSFWPVSLVSGLVALLAVVAAGFMVASVFASGQRRLSRQNATLSALGATPGQIVRPVVRQAALVGLVGSVIGVVVAFVLTLLGRVVLAGQGLELGLGWLWLVLGVVIALVVGLALTLVAARWGAAKAVAASLAEQDGRVAPARPGVRPAPLVFGFALIVVGVAAGLWGARQGVLGPWLIAAGSVVALIGLVLVGPLLMLGLGRVFAAVLRLFSSLPARLARGRVLGHPAKSAGLAGVFVVALALASALVVLAGSAQTGDRAAAEREVTADFVVTSTEPGGVIADSVVGLMSQQAPGAIFISYGEAPVRALLPDQSAPSDARVMFGPDDTFTLAGAGTVVDGAADAFGSRLAVSQSYAEATGLKVGDTVELDLASDTPFAVTTSLTVGLIVDTALFRDLMVPRSWITAQSMIPSSALGQLMMPDLVLVTAPEGADLDSVREKLTETVAPYRTIQVQTRDDFIAGFAPHAATTAGIGWALAGAGSVLALLAVVNVLGGLAGERRREIGLLKAMGLPDRQVGRSVVFESTIIGLTGGLTGIVAGVGLAFLARRAFGWLGVTTVTIPWLWLVVLFVLAILIGALAGLIPARRAARLPVAVALA